MTWGTTLAVAFGAVYVVQALRVRAGKSRTFYAVHRTAGPPWVPNRVFALFPGGVALMTGAIVVAMSGPNRGIVLGSLILITWIGMVCSIVWMFSPPSFLKPRWLLDVESGRSSDEAPTPVLGAPARGRSRPRTWLNPSTARSGC